MTTATRTADDLRAQAWSEEQHRLDDITQRAISLATIFYPANYTQRAYAFVIGRLLYVPLAFSLYRRTVRKTSFAFFERMLLALALLRMARTIVGLCHYAVVSAYVAVKVKDGDKFRRLMSRVGDRVKQHVAAVDDEQSAEGAKKVKLLKGYGLQATFLTCLYAALRWR